MIRLKSSCIFTLVMLFTLDSFCQVHDKSWSKIVHDQNDDWYGSEAAIEYAENVLLYQRDIGGWPKNIQMHHAIDEAQRAALIALKPIGKDCTIDNGATVNEMIFLSKVYAQTGSLKYEVGFLRGLQYLLEAQYDNGGWPQFYPLKKGYHDRITFNDDAMVNVMNLLRDIKKEKLPIIFSPGLLIRVEAAFEKGIVCILKTQIKQEGKLTGWCAQYDENTLQPAKARAYELPSLSGKESTEIVLLLMKIKNPSKAIRKAINGAVTWMEAAKIEGMKEVMVRDENGKVIDKKLVPETDAPLLWARFMDLETNKPFFCDRDGIKKSSMDEIGLERRVGYGWYSEAPNKVLKKYVSWQKKNKL